MQRRDFLLETLHALPMAWPALLASAGTHDGEAPATVTSATPVPRPEAAAITLFLCGDVMTGRGIDQILPHPGNPVLYEDYVRSALGYVALAEQVSGPLPRAVAWDYLWGEALALLDRAAPALRLINLETAVTRHDRPWPKGINYRMHPANLPCLNAARINGAVLANNHVLDWGAAGLADTLASLHAAGIVTVGAGRNRSAAAHPAIWPLAGGGRVLLFAYALPSSGTPSAWAARRGREGVNWLPGLSASSLTTVRSDVAAAKQAGDLVLLSLHWGGNWVQTLPAEHIRFAHALIDQARVDLVWGHSSHHPLAMEVYGGKLILYGCGDLINDYEGISGYEAFRPELALLYLPTLSSDGKLLRLRLEPLRRRRFRLERANAADTDWLARTLSQTSRTLGSQVQAEADGSLSLH